MHTDSDQNTPDDPTISRRPTVADGTDWEETVDEENSTSIQEIVHAQIQGNLLKHHSLLTFNIGGIQLFSTIDEEIIFGRSSEQAFDHQIIDLTGFKAREAGVSRRHAALQRDESGQIVLIDLESSNGTTINGEQLVPLYAYPVQDGDEISFGYLTLVIRFEGG